MVVQELQAEVDTLRQSFSELQAAHEALGGEARKAQQQVAALREPRQVPPPSGLCHHCFLPACLHPRPASRRVLPWCHIYPPQSAATPLRADTSYSWEVSLRHETRSQHPGRW